MKCNAFQTYIYRSYNVALLSPFKACVKAKNLEWLGSSNVASTSDLGVTQGKSTGAHKEILFSGIVILNDSVCYLSPNQMVDLALLDPICSPSCPYCLGALTKLVTVSFVLYGSFEAVLVSYLACNSCIYLQLTLGTSS